MALNDILSPAAGLASSFLEGFTYPDRGSSGSGADLLNAEQRRIEFAAKQEAEKKQLQAAGLVAPQIATFFEDIGTGPAKAVAAQLRAQPVETLRAFGGDPTKIFGLAEAFAKEREADIVHENVSDLSDLMNDRAFRSLPASDQFAQIRPLVKDAKEAEKIVENLSSGGANDLLKDREDFTTLRGQFESTSKPFRDLTSQYYALRDTLEAGNREPSKARDIAAIFQFMKVLDRMSTVREGEAEQVAQARSLRETFGEWYNRLLGHETLAPQQRIELINAARDVTASWARTQERLTSGQRQFASYLAGGNQKKVDALMAGLELTPEDKVEFGLESREVQRFIGGDPEEQLKRIEALPTVP